MNKTKENTLSLLCIVLSLFGILMLLFSIFKYSHYYGVSSANGFSLLDFDSPEIGDDYSGILGALSWLQLLIGIGSFACSLLTLKRKPNSIKPFVTVVVAIWSSSLLFLLEGIIAVSMSSVSFATHTTWIPFVIISILSIITIIFLDAYKKQPVSSASNYTSNSQAFTSSSNQNISNNTNPSLTQVVPQDDGCIFTVDGEVKLLKVYNDYITMENKTNLRAILTHNVFGGNKKVFYQNMLGVQFKESSSLVLGYIQFETANTFSKDNFNSENSVTFSHTKVPNEYVKQIVDFVEGKILASKTPISITQSSSSADELLKFKNLLDAGVISQEEFDKKKNELLNK